MAVEAAEQFPWHLGVYDAHCHPTDTMSSVEEIPRMKTRCLAVMATRPQDQDLVARSADGLGISSPDDVDDGGGTGGEGRIVPAFGWHPWFSHQLFDDSPKGAKEHRLSGEEKLAHYQTVLSPKRPHPSESDIQFFAALPDPYPLSVFLADTRARLQSRPYALIGEVGLDKSFRLPQTWLPEHQEQRDATLTPGGREGRRLSPFRVDMEHQKKILLAQLSLAAELGRAVSVHGVQAHGLLFDLLQQTWKGHEKQRPFSKRSLKREQQKASGHPCVDDAQLAQKPGYPPRICLHSYGGNSSAFKRYLDPVIPAQIFASFSTAINVKDPDEKTPGALAALIKVVPDDFLLVESDLHTAGAAMDAHLEDMVRRMCHVKGWTLQDGVKQLGRNWKRFVFGTSDS